MLATTTTEPRARYDVHWSVTLALVYVAAMNFPTFGRVRPAIAALAALFLFPTFSLAAQPTPAAASETDELPWLYEGSDVPVDRSWTFGTLENGLRYAVKRNGVPPGQVSMRMRVDVGSLMEEDDELGFAHLMEHLAFRGSRHVPDGEAKRVWQRLGATFGSDSNAETTPTQTVYKLDLPNANPDSLDESMEIIAGMLSAPGLSASAVSAERPVVLAELAERRGPQTKVVDATRSHFFAGQRLAERAPIGTPETLRRATSKGLREFHRRWYRPENTVVVIAGDADPALLERLVAKHFSDWRGTGATGTPPPFGDPAPIATDGKVIIEPNLPRYVSMMTARPWRRVDDTIVYNEGILTDLLAMQLINRRLETRARGGGSYLQAGVSQDDVSRSVDATFVNIVPLSNDWEAALDDVRAVIADATTTAPSEEDIEREVREFDAALAIGAEGYATEAARKQADDIVRAVDIRETVATPQVALDVFRAMRDKLTPERLLQSTRDLFAGDVTRVVMTSPEEVADGDQRLSAALNRDVLADGNARLAQEALDFDALPDLGEPGAVVNSRTIDRFDMEAIELSNGVRALLFPNKSERNKVMVNVRFGSGYSGLPTDAENLAWTGPLALIASGIGELGQQELDTITTGRRIGLGFDVDDNAYEIRADTRPADLEDQLRLIAAKLEHPRWDAAPVERMRAGSLIGYDSFSASPQAVLQRDLEWLTTDRDPRWKTPDRATFDAVTPEAFRAFWEPKLREGPVEVMLFGDFERDAAVEAVRSTFGAIAPRSETSLPSAESSPSFPAPGAGPEVLTHKGDRARAAAIVAWPTGGGLEDIRTSRRLEVLVSLFNDRMFEILRSKEGASYSPQVVNNWPDHFTRGGYIAASSQLTPDNVDRFFSVAETIARDLRDRPVDQDELDRVIEPLRQLISRASSGNTFWLSQLEGATYRPEKFEKLGTLLSDYTEITPAEVQALAHQYLTDAAAWKLIVLPESADAVAGTTR